MLRLNFGNSIVLVSDQSINKKIINLGKFKRDIIFKFVPSITFKQYRHTQKYFIHHIPPT